jgi:hypothetical protein
MGWHYTLIVKCSIHPDFLEFYKQKYLQNVYMHVYSRKGRVSSYEYDSDFEEDDRSVTSTESMYETELFREYRIIPNNSFLDTVPKTFRDYLQFWISLEIGSFFYEFDVKENELYLKMSKKVNTHRGNSFTLQTDYEAFLHHIVVPTTTCIHECRIESDDYGDHVWHYSDSQLRCRPFQAKELIGEVEHVWDQGSIVETRITYKKPIPPHQKLDLNRFYGGSGSC